MTFRREQEMGYRREEEVHGEEAEGKGREARDELYKGSRKWVKGVMQEMNFRREVGNGLMKESRSPWTGSKR
jgi:hypothetical protein